MRRTISISLFLILAVIMLLPVYAAAWGENYNLKMDFGTSYRLALFGQTLNPDAAKNLAPVEGMSGQNANQALQNYNKGFQVPITIVKPMGTESIREYTAPSSVIQVQGSDSQGASLTPIVPAGGPGMSSK